MHCTITKYQFTSDANKIQTSVAITMRTTLSAVNSLAANFVAIQKASNSTLPFVTVPNLPLQAAKLKAQSYVMGLHYVITDEERSDWEEYASRHGPKWVAESWETQAQDPTFYGSLETYSSLQNQIFTNFPPLVEPVPEGSGPYLVAWQSYPITYDPNSAPYNYHILPFPRLQQMYNATLRTKRPAFGGFTLADPESHITGQIIMELQEFYSRF